MPRRIFKCFQQGHPIVKYGRFYEEEFGYLQEIKMLPKKDYPQILEFGGYVGPMIPLKHASDGVMEINMGKTGDQGLGYSEAKLNSLILH